MYSSLKRIHVSGRLTAVGSFLLDQRTRQTVSRDRSACLNVSETPFDGLVERVCARKREACRATLNPARQPCVARCLHAAQIMAKWFRPWCGLLVLAALPPSLICSWLVGEHPVLREFNIELRHGFLTDLDFKAETVSRSISPDVRFECAGELELSIGHDFERQSFDFDIRRDGSVIVPTGSRYTWEIEMAGNTAPQRRVSGGGGIGYAGFWTGTRPDTSLIATMRPGPGISGSTWWYRSNVRLGAGSFKTNLVRASTRLALSPWAAFSANVQYDDLSRILGLYGRLLWVIRPGSDIDLVYTHRF